MLAEYDHAGFLRELMRLSRMFKISAFELISESYYMSDADKRRVLELAASQ